MASSLHPRLRGTCLYLVLTPTQWRPTSMISAVSRRTYTRPSGTGQTCSLPLWRACQKVATCFCNSCSYSAARAYQICSYVERPTNVHFILTEEQRELARQQLKLLLKAGYSPLRFYVHDIKKYYYLGELLSVVDLSLVSSQGRPR